MGSWPEAVGILAIELYFPSQYVEQSELEQHDGVPSGKYTVGLGQRRMGFCSDREDVHSLCLTAVQRLLERHGVAHSSIGRLEVGTETLLDKSKSVKSVLMQLFEPHGATDVEGVDSTNACYGGTAALLNAVAWVESSAWDGRLALVVAADIAVYAKGPARPTGGAGAVAMLVGPGAPLVLERGLRATHVQHAYDFYKPDLSSEYPTVDGPLSIRCYLSALDRCYRLYKEKAARRGLAASLDRFDAVLFHSPFCKLVQKSLARLALHDFLDAPERHPHLGRFANIALADSYFDKEVERAFLAHSEPAFQAKTRPSLLVAREVGNMYTPSLYGGLVSHLLSRGAEELAGSRLALFSYGSGLAATLFSVTVARECGEGSPLRKLLEKLGEVEPLLRQRRKVSPEKFEACLEMRERNGHRAPYDPVGDVDHLFPGTFYLARVDERHRRFYERVPSATNGHVE